MLQDDPDLDEEGQAAFAEASEVREQVPQSSELLLVLPSCRL